MDYPTELTLYDVRCFQGEQRGRLRPITLLVGENSTGKSTFLGCYSVLHRMFLGSWDFEQRLDFNVEPFSMGSFRDVVRSRRGPSGRINSFKIGMTFSQRSRRDIPSHHLVATFSEHGSQPVVTSLRFEFDDDCFLELRPNIEGTILAIPEFEENIEYPINHVMYLLELLIRQEDLHYGQMSEQLQVKLYPVAEYLRGLLRKFGTVGSLQSPGAKISSLVRPPRLPALVPVAPLRSKPKRTYDPVRETTSPEGEHIPMLMMRLDHTDKNEWNSLHDSLVRFGRESGLLSDIKVKRHGGQMSDPFQLQVKARSGMHANIVDVGYGVSQCLPILVDILTANEKGSRRRKSGGCTFLLQQPEVHLHPRSQAELASLLVESYEKGGNRFLVETHSDYIIDRVRISVRKKKIKADQVSVLYFEPRGNAVNIHNITLDNHGNLEGAPAGYRRFFLKETDELLGFEESVSG